MSYVRKSRGKNNIRQRASWLMPSLLMILLISGCAPTLYSINLRYQGTAEPMPDSWQRKFITTVALFNDARSGGEDLLVGRVVTSSGAVSQVIPKTMRPAAAVSEITRDFLIKYGYQLSAAKPTWDLTAEAINREWGRVVIGGNIDEMEVICQNDIPTKTYEAKVKITIVVADVAAGKIIHRITTTSTNSLKHVYFSEELLGRQLSIAISEAVESALTTPTLKEKIKNALDQ